jgi:selenocysteine-specific elongation factor
VDRVFVQKGFGCVVTGTSHSGAIEEGDELLLLPQGQTVRVRGLEVHGEARKRAVAGERTAINLAGVDAHDLARGCVLVSPKSLEARSILDVRYRHLQSAPVMENRARVRLLLGTAEVLAVAEKISPGESFQPGEEIWVQLRCDRPIVCHPGDRFILRRESPLTTLGGGAIVDPWATRLRKKEKDALLSLLSRMDTGDSCARVERAGAGGLSREEAKSRSLFETKDASWLGDRLLSNTEIRRAQATLLQVLAKAHTALPLSPGIPQRSLKKGALLQLSAPAYDALIGRLAAKEELCMEGGRLRLPDWSVKLSTEDQAASETLKSQLKKGALDPPPLSEITLACSDPEALIALLVSQKELYRIAGRLYEVTPIEDLKHAVSKLLSEEGELSPGRFKALTGLSRKGAIPLLEFLDQEGLTKRVGDVRVAATSCSP